MGKGSGGCERQATALTTGGLSAQYIQALIEELNSVDLRYLTEEAIEEHQASDGDPHASLIPHIIQDRLAAIANDEDCPEEIRQRAREQLTAAHQLWIHHVVTSKQLFNEEEENEELLAAGYFGLAAAMDEYDPNDDVSFASLARRRAYEEMKHAVAERPIDQEYAQSIVAELGELERKYMKRRRPQREITQGDQLYLRAVDKNPVLPYAVQDRLIALQRDTRLPEHLRRRARELVVMTNQKWVILHAHSRKMKGRGVSPQDLIQAGNEGLLEAIGQYDLSRPNSFITFAKHKINMRMQRLSENDSAGVHGVRLPVDYYNFVHVTVKRVHTSLSTELNRAPSVDEVHARLAAQYETKNEEVPASKRKKVPTLDDTVEAMDWLLHRSPVSLQQRLRSDDDDMEFGALLEDDRRVENTASQHEANNMINRAFEALTPEEQKVLGSSIGHGDYPELKTMKNIAEYYDLKAPTVKRLLESARSKMQASITEAGYTKTTQLS